MRVDQPGKYKSVFKMKKQIIFLVCWQGAIRAYTFYFTIGYDHLFN
jgi:hypothetical protein